MLRLLDIVLSALGLLFTWPLLLLVTLLGWFDTGSPLFAQRRVGRHQKPFTLYKFRSMRPQAAQVATHLADASQITPLGRFLRRSKLDELPQLWNVLLGDMSLVGPRPCLFNQTELIAERSARGVFDVRPGITGLAQVNGIDMSEPRLLAEWDARMLATLDLGQYLRYVVLTALGRGTGDRVRESVRVEAPVPGGAVSPATAIPPNAILVTGATGFVGQGLTQALAARGMPWLGIARRASNGVLAGPELGPEADFVPFLQGARAVVHLAARVHVMNETDTQAEQAYERANVQGTLRLAEQAVAAGVKRFVFVSSVKVLGEATLPGQLFTHNSPLAPQDAYGRSKARAEQALRALAARTGLEVVIIRPPLVYGPGVGGNFAQLIRVVRRRLPLPMGGIRNQRSLVSRSNLVDLIMHTLEHPAAPGKAWLVSDGQDVSTPELLQALGQALGQRLWLPPVPEGVLRAVGRALGRQAALDRLCGSLQVDISATREQLGWTPPVTMQEALREAVKRPSAQD